MQLNMVQINHGIALSADGKTLYASTTEAAYSWDYDDATMTVGSTNKTIVNGMQTDDHTTRTLLLSKQVPNMLVVSRGSTSNLDVGAETLSTGRSQIRAFDITSSTPHDYSTSGTLLGWGLRNSVGVTEHPITGSIYSVENSVDQMMRMGSDVHENNPGEEMNFHGYLNGTKTTEQGSNYGYPNCFAAWQPADLPGNENIKVGTQFAIGDQNATVNDTTCTQAHAAPRLTFQAHMAPLDMKFNASGTEGWTTFHGSWDRTSPSGYKVSVIQFDRATGEPTVPSTSNSSYTDVFYNADNSVCPDSCFRPVGLAFDTMGRMWVSSDATGEIYVVRRVGATSAANGTALGTGSGASSTSTSMSGVSKVEVGWGMGAVVVGLVGAVVFFAL
jgi:glucose/arabinose dehydrogenase